MDPLSATASVIAVLQFAEEAIKIIKDVKVAEKEQRKLVDELQTLGAMLKDLVDRRKNAQPSDPWCQGFLKLVETSGTLTSKWEYVEPANGNPDGPLARLFMTMAKMLAKLDPSHPSHPSHSSHHWKNWGQKLGRRLVWHWDKEKYEGMLKDIEICRQNIRWILDEDHAALSLDTNLQVGKVHVQVQDSHVQILDMKNDIQTLRDSDRKRQEEEKTQKEETERDGIIHWLSPLEFLKTQDKLSHDRFETGQFLLDDDVFKYWATGRQWRLRCYGEAGSGKTILASIVINHLQEKFQTQDSPVICMYLDYKESRAQTLENLLGSLLKQLIQLKASRSVSMELQELYRKARRIGNPEPGLKDICKILYTEIANYKRIYLVVDALDECTAAYQLLGELSKLPPEKLSLMITSRRIEGGMPFKEVFCDLCPKSDLKIYFQCDNCVEKVDLCEDCKGMNPCKDKSHKLVEPYDEVEIDVHIPDEDLKRYVEFEIGEEAGYGSQRWDERMHSSRPGATKFARKCQKDPELMNRIPAVIVEKADGRFLYAKLYVASLKTRQTIEQIKTTLETFPDNLNDLYAENLQRIQRQDRVDRELGFKVLSRTVCARRPLSLAELQQLLATNPGDRDFNKDRDYDKQDILSSTAGLITIDGEKNVVRLVHLTLHTYLSLDDVRQEWFPQAEMEMASACLTCLNFDAFSEHTQDTEDFEAKKREHPFVAYASQYWGTHVLDADPDPYIEAKTVQLVNDPHRIAAYTQIAWSTDRGSASSWDVRSKGIDGLHICAWFGLTSIIAILLQDGHDVDVQEETYGQTPLIYACRAGHVDVVVQLLDHGACVTKFSLRGRTAMFEAIDQNHEEIVNHLLVVKELDINAVQPKHSNRTALMLAADREHFGIVTSLLNHPRIDVNQEDLFGRTALFYAAVKGSYMIVQDLLQHPGIDVNRADKLVKRSPLIIAAARDYDKIVELLLEGGADPMLKDLQGGGTAMHRAIDNGCTSVIETMLKYDIVNFQCLDDDGRSLLHAASASGQLDIFHLLKKKNLDSNAQDKQGLTPLHGACRHGQLQITKALLELGADPAIRDNFGRIPLTVAWQYGQTQVMDVLKGNAPAARGNSTSIPDAKNLPLWSLARLGLADLIQQAVAAEKSESSPREPGSDNTALHCAIEAGKIDILRILLQKDHASIDYVNRYLRAPLHIAAVKGDIDALTELLKYHAEVDLIDIWGDTPLSLAQSNNHWPVAIALIEQGAEINRQKIDIKKMFFASIEQSNIKVVKLLLRLGADVLSRNMEGITAIQLAQEIGNDQMVRVLQSSPSFYYKAPGKDSEDTSSSTNSTSSMALKLDHDVVPFRSRPMPSICEPMAN